MLRKLQKRLFTGHCKIILHLHFNEQKIKIFVTWSCIRSLAEFEVIIENVQQQYKRIYYKWKFCKYGALWLKVWKKCGKLLTTALVSRDNFIKIEMRLPLTYLAFLSLNAGACFTKHVRVWVGPYIWAQILNLYQ